MGYGGCPYYSWCIVKGILFILACFVFSFIFWLTKQWIDRKCPKKKK